jgi:hypothetical protein
MTIHNRFAFLVWPALAVAALFTSTDSAAQVTDALPFETAVVETVQRRHRRSDEPGDNVCTDLGAYRRGFF